MMMCICYRSPEQSPFDPSLWGHDLSSSNLPAASEKQRKKIKIINFPRGPLNTNQPFYQPLTIGPLCKILMLKIT